MRIILETDTEKDGYRPDDVETIIKATELRIALWDINQMFVNAKKYEGLVKDGEYLTEKEYEIVDKLHKKFSDILGSNRVKQLVLEMS